MTEPTTPNIGLTVPNTGDLPGAWGTSALNPNFLQVDGMLGGVVSFSLSAATSITLTTPGATTVFTPTGGPNQSSNALISLSGSLSGNATLKLTVPGHYSVSNQCTVGTNFVQLSPVSGGGKSVGCPDGEARRFFFNGTDVIFLDMPHVGTLHNFCVSTTPAWFAG